MKGLYLFLTILFLTASAFAQQDTVWRRGGLVSINLSQVSLTNWSAGGENSVAGNGIVNIFANYKRGKIAWDNNLDLAYGLIVQGKNDDVTKSDDKIDFTSKYGIQASKNWYYTALLNFRSQFSPGYNYPNDSLVISNFLAPAYITLGLGMDYKPSKHFSLFLSPASARWVIVNDEFLRSVGAFGVDTGETVEFEFGALVKATVNVDLTKTTNLMTTLDLFSNYLEDPQNIDVNWQMLLSIKINEFFSASLSAQVIYDDNTTILFYNNDDSFNHAGKGTQFKEVLGIGLAYRLNGFTVK
jgi:hypothetical protein